MGPKAAAMVMGLLAAACVSQPVRAAQGDWLFRAGATLLDPKKTNLKIRAGELEFDDAVSLRSVSPTCPDHVATELMSRGRSSESISGRTTATFLSSATSSSFRRP